MTAKKPAITAVMEKSLCNWLNWFSAGVWACPVFSKILYTGGARQANKGPWLAAVRGCGCGDLHGLLACVKHKCAGAGEKKAAFCLPAEHADNG